ncbi:MAG: hypothetical protein HY842_20340, partial [Bacteroidetes bacterium]|nr:hypothetical protein [Bacteroidota bacterium]
MKKIKLFILTLTLVAASFATADAQVYHSAIGARLGWPVSFSYKTFISQKSALEGYVGYRGYSFYNWISVSGAYLYHSPFPDVDNLQWYVGGGASMYFWNYDDTFSTPGSNTGTSIQGYLGL